MFRMICRTVPDEPGHEYCVPSMPQRQAHIRLFHGFADESINSYTNVPKNSAPYSFHLEMALLNI